jgi:hypothetical protein
LAPALTDLISGLLPAAIDQQLQHCWFGLCGSALLSVLLSLLLLLLLLLPAACLLTVQANLW